jgi:hypothetical protein
MFSHDDGACCWRCAQLWLREPEPRGRGGKEEGGRSLTPQEALAL